MSVPQLKYRTTLRHPHAHLIVGFRPRTGLHSQRSTSGGASMQRCIVSLLIHVNVNISTMYPSAAGLASSP